MKYLDIRLTEEYHVQPTLFGPPLVTVAYRLVDWDTEQPINEERYNSLADAEREMCRVLSPYLSQWAAAHAEQEEGEDTHAEPRV